MKRFLYLLAASIVAASSLEARIGEPRTSIENRFQSKLNGAYFYSSAEEKFREAMELPYKYLILLMPKDAQNCFYFKRFDRVTATNSDVIQQHDLVGWELHIVFQGGSSVLEFYTHHGNPMTIEELEGLMEAVAKSRGDAHWEKSDFIKVHNQIDMSFDGKNLSEKKKSSEKNLRDILPENKNRFIYVEVLPDFKNSSAYSGSLQAKIMEDEQQRAHDAYNKRISDQAEYRALKTQRNDKKSKKKTQPSSTEKINKFDGNPFRVLETPIFLPNENGSGVLSLVKYNSFNYLFGGRPKVNRDRIIQIPMNIPFQDDTCIGYDYVLSDGSVRAKLFKEGILFISSKFDKFMRERMEKLYSDQNKVRKAEAEDSISKF